MKSGDLLLGGKGWIQIPLLNSIADLRLVLVKFWGLLVVGEIGGNWSRWGGGGTDRYERGRYVDDEFDDIG